MALDLLSYIRLHRNSFSRSGVVIADFILEHAEEVVDMPISRVAICCNVCESTVHRFCVSIGLTGFVDMRTSLAACLRMKEDSKLDKLDEKYANDPCANAAFHLCEGMISSMRDTWRMINIEALHDIAEHMHRARHIVLFGLDSAMYFALIAYQRLLRLSHNVVCPQGEEMQIDKSKCIQKGDVAIFFTEGRLVREGVTCVERCKQNGAYTVSLSNEMCSPLTRFCDVALYYDNRDGSRLATSPSFHGVRYYLLETLCAFYKAELEGGWK